MNQVIEQEDAAFNSIPSGKLGMWMFLIMDGLSFVAILIAAAYLRTNGAPWPNPGEVLNIPLTAFNTFVLLTSSYTMMQALEHVRAGNQTKFIQALGWTLFLGVLFLGVQAYEYFHLIAAENFRPGVSIYAGCFFGATGFHGLHVLTGVIFIIYVLVGALKGRFNKDNHLRVETLTLFWHFVDLMWMLVFTCVYLL